MIWTDYSQPNNQSTDLNEEGKRSLKECTDKNSGVQDKCTGNSLVNGADHRKVCACLQVCESDMSPSHEAQKSKHWQ